MTGAAEIRVAGRHGMFVADACNVDGPWIHAEGRWRTRGGSNNTELRWGEPAAYSWPVAQVVEIRWAAGA